MESKRKEPANYSCTTFHNKTNDSVTAVITLHSAFNNRLPQITQKFKKILDAEAKKSRGGQDAK